MNEQRIPTFGIREATSALLLWVTLMLVGIQCCIAISPAGKVVGTYLPQVEPGTGFTNVAAGDYFTVLQDDAGRLYVVGNGPVIPPGLSNVVGLAAGGSHVDPYPARKKSGMRCSMYSQRTSNHWSMTGGSLAASTLDEPASASKAEAMPTNRPW